MKGFVYVIGSDDFPFVKIGHTTNVKKRLCQLQSGNPFTLKVLATREGTWALEQLIHRSYAFQRIRGEWFDFGGDDPVKLVDDVIHLVGDVLKDSQPEPRKTPATPRMPRSERSAQLFGIITSAEGVSLSELARLTGASKSAVKRGLDDLARTRHIFRDTDDMWHPNS